MADWFFRSTAVAMNDAVHRPVCFYLKILEVVARLHVLVDAGKQECMRNQMKTWSHHYRSKMMIPSYENQNVVLKAKHTLDDGNWVGES